MKTYLVSSVFAALVCAAAPAFAITPAAPAELVTNGTFESYSGGDFGKYITIGTGSNALGDEWKISGSLDIIRNCCGAINGNSIDMLGSPGPGSLSQTLKTFIGQTYKLTFDLSQNTGGDYTADAKTVRVSLTGTPSVDFTADYTGVKPVAHEVLSFTATSAETLLTFSSITKGDSGAVLDNVSVTAVPEPESYAMLLAGLGLMATLARRRGRRPA